MNAIQVQGPLGLPPRVIEKLTKGQARKIPRIITFPFEVNDGETIQLDTRTPSSGCFQVEAINTGGNDVFLYNIKDTYFNQAWFDSEVYNFLMGGDGRSMGLLPCPVILPPSTQIIVNIRYDATDPNTGGSDKVVGQILLIGYILDGITAEDLNLR